MAEHRNNHFLLDSLPTRKRPVTQPDRRFTYHLKRLANKRVSVIREIYEACQPSKRDMANGPGLVYNRFLAAKFLLELAEDKIEPAKLNLYLDRTEGKVVDVIVSGSFNDMVQVLEAGRQRLLQLRAPQQAIEGEIVTPQPEVVSDAVIAPENPHAEPVSTDSDTSK